MSQETWRCAIVSLIRTRAPLSSMFTILSLFTEDVKLRHGNQQENTSVRPSEMSDRMEDSGMADQSSSESKVVSPESPRLHFAKSQRAFDSEHESAENGNMHTHDIPQIPLLDNTESDAEVKFKNSVHPGIIARANIDTTIAIIPAEVSYMLLNDELELKRVGISKIDTDFSKSFCTHCTSDYDSFSKVRFCPHTFHVWLKHDRVTFATGHNYLGLTAEILRTERQMNNLTTYDLPNYVQPSSLEKIKNKIERANAQTEEGNHGNGLIISTPSKRRPTSIRLGSLRKQMATNSQLINQGKQESSTKLDSKESTSEASNSKSALGRETDEDDGIFRDSVLHCMFKALGLEDQPNRIKSGNTSVEQSPHIVPLDSSKNTRASFGSTLGNLAMYDTALSGSDAGSESAFTSNSLDGIETEIDNDLEIIHFPAGAVLVEAQERNPGLYYVIDGFLDVGLLVPSETTPLGRRSRRNAHFSSDMNPFEEEFEDIDDGFKSLYLVKPGGIAGYQAGIGNYRSFVDVRAKTDVLVGFLPRASLERIMEKKPVVLLTMAKRLISLLSPLILHLDFALEWVQVGAGQIVYHQGEEADAIYIVLNGRVRSLRSRNADSTEGEITGEYGNGQSVGELEVLTDMTRPSTLHAVRETELARFPKQLFQSLASEHPG